ncbi:MAG: DinB family protein [Alphaproteobacteria bacterium]
MNHLPLMARFNAWVNARLYDTVAGLADHEYRRDRGAFFGSIHHTLNHLLVVDRLWTGRIERTDRGITALDQVLYQAFDDLRAARRAEDSRLIALVDGLDDAALARPVVYRRIIGEGEEEVRTDHVLITLFNHQTHHRGQVHAMLTQAGTAPPPLDVVFFLDETGQAGPPGTVDPAAR